MEDIIITFATIAAFVAAFVVIIRKAGYSGWWMLIAIVPPVNIVMLLVFAFRQWPIQRELARLRVIAGSAIQADFDSLVTEAVSADQTGEWIHAVHLFELVASKSPGDETRAYATDSIERIKEKIGAQQIPDNPYAAPRQTSA